MASIATYVFLDFETTGIPREEDNRTRITEMSFVAVKRDHLLDTRPGDSPRVQHKLTLCLNPGKQIHPGCTDVTGLDNFLLEHEAHFDLQVFNLVNTFINVLTKPVCLVAQNGHNFDFPILKNHLEKLKVSLDNELLCADSYHAFYDILEARKKKEASIEHEATTVDVNTTLNTSVDEVDFMNQQNTLAMQKQNEGTPKQPVKQTLAQTPVKSRELRNAKSRRRLPWSSGAKPSDSYKLKDIYERLLNRPAFDAHRAENDCIFMLECAVVLGEDFTKWVDENSCQFSEVNPMTIGVRIGW